MRIFTLLLLLQRARGVADTIFFDSPSLSVYVPAGAGATGFLTLSVSFLYASAAGTTVRPTLIDTASAPWGVDMLGGGLFLGQALVTLPPTGGAVVRANASVVLDGASPFEMIAHLGSDLGASGLLVLRSACRATRART
jgi:hypothetical protein